MRKLRGWIMRFAGLFNKQHKDQEFQEELESHIQMHIEDNLRLGMTPAEARRQAMIQLGGFESTKEAYREQRSLPLLETLSQDLRYGVRMLRKNPGFAAVAVLTLALGIGAATAVFSAIDLMVLHPLPGPASDRLVEVGERQRESPSVSMSALAALQANPDCFSEFAWADNLGLQYNPDGLAQVIGGAMVSPNFFTLWGVRPLLGRTFAKGEGTTLDSAGTPENDTVIVLSYPAWQSLCGSDPKILGKTIRLAERDFAIIGVMPRYFRIPGGGTQFWVPVRSLPTVPIMRNLRSDWAASPNIQAFGLLKSGVSQQATEARLNVLFPSIVQAERSLGDLAPTDQAAGGFWVRSARSVFAQNIAGYIQVLSRLLGVIAFVLLIGYLNLASQTLAQSEKRRHEYAVRAALGAGRRRLVRQLLTEHALAGAIAGLLALPVAHGVLKLIVAWIPTWSLQCAAPIQVDRALMGVCVLVSVGVGLAFGSVPAWYASRTDVGETLKQTSSQAIGDRKWGRYREAVVVAQIALAFALLTGSGLMVESVFRLLAVPGYDAQNLLLMKVLLPIRINAKIEASSGTNHTRVGESIAPRFAVLEERLASVPGVETIGVLGRGGYSKYEIEEGTAQVELCRLQCGFGKTDLLRALRIGLLAGRYLESSDSSPADSGVVINQAMARLCWPGRSPLGGVFREDTSEGRLGLYRVVGVVSNAYPSAADDAATFYEALPSTPASPFRTFYVRTGGDPLRFTPSLRRVLAATEPGMNQPFMESVSQARYDATNVQRAYMLWLLISGAVGLLLVVVGIYSVLALSVVRRTREIGLRLALGARPRDILVAVLSKGARLIALGILAGFLASFWLTRLLQHELFDTSGLNPVVWLGAALLLAGVGLPACYLPGRGAAKTNPMEALRHE